MSNQITQEDLDLLRDLGVSIESDPPSEISPREERIMAGFEEIERFVQQQGRLPCHGEDRDIFERIYAVRLDRLRASEECRAILQPLDSLGLLQGTPVVDSSTDNLTDEELLACLGVDVMADADITRLTHVRSFQEKSQHREIKAAEDVAQRTACPDFDQFQDIFEQVQRDLKAGIRQTVKYQDNAAVKTGDLFILDGHKVLVAAMGEPFTAEHGRSDRRLRVIYDNGTESDLLLRSLQRALNKDKTSRRITTPDLGPLFSQKVSDEDFSSGSIYVLRSESNHPFIQQHRSLIHKIGVTRGDVKKRIAHAAKDSTYLLAEVEVVAEFKLTHINPQKLENMLLKFFSCAQLDLELVDRFGVPVKPREWFLVPLEIIQAAIEHIKTGTLDQVFYDPTTGSLQTRDSSTA